MKRNWLWGLLLILLLLINGNPVTTKTVVAQASSMSEVLRLVNQVRAGYGLPPFVWDSALAAAAQNQANYLASHNIYSHSGAGGSTPQSRAIAAGYQGRATENIVGGTNLTPSQGVIWWQNSPSHFNTMISQRYVHAGVGFAQGHDQNFYALVVGGQSDQLDGSLPGEASVPGDETLAPVAPIQLAESGEDGAIIHVVGPGHSFWAIAARYEIPLNQLYLYNNLTGDSVINPGDRLIIRLADGQIPPPTPTPPASHIVGQGDSLWTIAAWYKLSLGELLWLNSMEEDSLLTPGDEVRIRLLEGEEPPPTATPQISHIVQNGDTAWGIALTYGLTVDELLANNALTVNSVLSIGDVLLIVPPSPTPTITPETTSTLPPTATAVATNTPKPTLKPTQQATSIVTEEPEAASGSGTSAAGVRQGLGATMTVIGVGLVAVGAIAIVLIKRQK